VGAGDRRSMMVCRRLAACRRRWVILAGPVEAIVVPAPSATHFLGGLPERSAISAR